MSNAGYGLVEKQGDEYKLTSEGQQFFADAVEQWTDTTWTAAISETEMMAGTYETTTHTRAVDPEFHATVLSRYDQTCPVSSVDHLGLLDVAHVLSWNEYPEYRADVANVLPLSKTHHAAFDRELLTLDLEYRLRLNPEFDTESESLQCTIINLAGECASLSAESLDPDYLEQHNTALAWV